MAKLRFRASCTTANAEFLKENRMENLTVNDKIVSAGKVLNVAEVKKYLA